MASVNATNVASTKMFDTAGEAKRNTGELGKEQFLQLLVTQLKYQDPMNPDNSTEFIAQLAQFSSLEGMTNLQDSFSGVQAYTLMGRVALKVDPLTKKETYGEVVGVKLVDGQYQLKLNTREGLVDVKLDEISEVYNLTPAG